MKIRNHLLATSATVLMAFGAVSAAQAAPVGTAVNTQIDNTASVAYSVGGTAQTPVTSNTASFLVDRKISIAVTEFGGAVTNVTGGDVNAVVSYTVTNNSNETINAALTVQQQSGGAGAFGGTDNFDANGPTIYVDTNGNGVYDAGTDTAATSITGLASGDSKRVFILSSIPTGRAVNDVATMILMAQATNPNNSNNPYTATAGANGNMTVETVLMDADGPATGDDANDGKDSAKDDYKVTATTLLSAAKTATVISDPVNGTTNAKMIPGATVRYCITVVNNSISADATAVTVSDTLPTTVTYKASTANSVTGTDANPTCSGGTAFTPGSTTIISNTYATVPRSGGWAAVYFDVTIN